AQPRRRHTGVRGACRHGGRRAVVGPRGGVVSDARRRTALVLVDLQQDYLARPGLVPDESSICGRAAALLAGVRRLGLPVAHARTLVRADGSDRMPHWKQQDVRHCVEGTPGADPPAALVAVPNELVARKRFFSAFGDPGLE